MKILTKKLINAGFGLSMIGMVYGCETTGAGALGTLMQVSPYSTPDERALGTVIGTASQMEHEKEVAREGRSQVNVNVRNKMEKRCEEYIDLFNLNNGEKEKRISQINENGGFDELEKYLLYKMRADKFPENGYLVFFIDCNKIGSKHKFIIENNKFTIKDIE